MGDGIAFKMNDDNDDFVFMNPPKQWNPEIFMEDYKNNKPIEEDNEEIALDKIGNPETQESIIALFSIFISFVGFILL